MPWIILEFVRLLAKLIIFVMVIIVWAVYLEENADESYLIATGVMGAATIGNPQDTVQETNEIAFCTH